MSRELRSLQKQATETVDSLRRIDERLAEYVEPTAAPLQLVKTKAQLEKRLDNLRKREQSLRGESESESGGRLPPLLTYDLDRSVQEFELSQKIDQLGPSASKPLICLIHGDDHQCHDKFVDCLEKIELRRVLSLKPDLAPYRVYIPKWPCQLTELDNFQERYRKSLADSILGYSRATQQDINDWLASHPEPMMIELEFLTRSWKKHAAKIVLKVLEFWRNWPDLAPHQVLLVCLSIKYPVQRRSPLFKVFGGKPISEEFSGALQALSHTSDNEIILAVLSMLKGVTQQDAEAWVRARERDLLTRFGEDVVDVLRDTIRTMFEQCQSQEDPKRIPMAEVTHQLRTIFRRRIADYEKFIL